MSRCEVIEIIVEEMDRVNEDAASLETLLTDPDLPPQERVAAFDALVSKLRCFAERLNQERSSIV